MLNLQLHTTIFKMATNFSENIELNSLVYSRCLKAINSHSLDGLCSPIEIKVFNERLERENVNMTSEEVTNRLKEIGVYQILANVVNKATPEFINNLNYLLLGSFGSAEVESVIRKRALEAIAKRNMEPLYKEINLDWRNGSYKITSEDLERKLKDKGIWQIVESEINRM